MANYNFTMKQFNGSTYDTLYPQTISQQVLLNDSALATALGLSGTPTVDDALTGLKNYIDSRVEIISHTGTGEYGSGHPVSLTFSKAPRVVFYIGTDTGGYTWPSYDSTIYSDKNVMYTDALTTTPTAVQGIGHSAKPDHSYGYKSSDGKTISWYNSDSQYAQLNGIGTTYYFLGVC